MTSKEAIKILKVPPEYTEDGEPIGHPEAIRLGTEALKREQWNRLHPAYPEEGLLPGETEE